ncbi:MAG: M23 family metallopeptidase [Desulfuromonadales bacterium]|nr:M23 family metallopeptidase [Desulfuromonadales bacterium]
MSRLLALVLIFLALAVVAGAGSLSLLPEQVADGEPAMVRWHGEPPAFGVLRFNERVIDFVPDQDGAVALLPVPLDLPSGDYPVLIALADRRGRTVAGELRLRVVRKERPVDRLTLPEQMVSPQKPEVLARIASERERLQELFADSGPRLWQDFRRPVDDPVSSVFGKRRILNGEPRAPHSGTDFRSPTGTPVRAIAGGRVVLVADLFYTGLTVILDHGAGLFSLYAHLSSFDVRADQMLDAGDLLGRVGSTGRSTGPHLHLTVRLHGERVDPLALLDLFGS